jgi:hypothetical protein
MKGNVEKDIKFIQETLYYPSKFVKIFKASEHSFRAKAFHDECNDINDTLVLVRTKTKKTIVGYSHYKWNFDKNEKGYEFRPNKAGGYNVVDSNRRTFLLLLDK